MTSAGFLPRRALADCSTACQICVRVTYLSVTKGLRTSNDLAGEASPFLCFIKKYYGSKIQKENFTVLSDQTENVNLLFFKKKIQNCKALDKRQVTNPCLK